MVLSVSPFSALLSADFFEEKKSKVETWMLFKVERYSGWNPIYHFKKIEISSPFYSSSPSQNVPNLCVTYLPIFNNFFYSLVVSFPKQTKMLLKITNWYSTGLHYDVEPLFFTVPKDCITGHSLDQLCLFWKPSISTRINSLYRVQC